MTVRTALITGAANGIGAATARRFASDGYNVALVDLLQSGQAVADEIGREKALFVAADVADVADVERAVAATLARFGGLDVLVNNAGVSLPKSLADTTPADWDRLHAVNLRALYVALKAAQAALAASGHGAVINIASFHAHATIANFAAYAASKAGVLGFTRSAAIEFAPYGIRVNAVAPGVIHTAMTQQWLEFGAGPEGCAGQHEREAAARAHRPARRGRRGDRIPGRRRGVVHRRHHALRRRRGDGASLARVIRGIASRPAST